MKRFIRLICLVSVIFSLILPVHAADPIYLPIIINDSSSEPVLPPISVKIPVDRATKVTYDETELLFAANVVDQDMEISIAPLQAAQVPRLDPGMVNVTRGPRQGYRYLPHMTFKQQFQISLPYDPAAIPSGLSAQDIKTFYYDESTRSWKELERILVDPETRTVTSLTNHFTDMINATIVVPDHPQPLHDNPTSMKDIKAADPGAGINLIEPPQANNLGDARLSYPIEVPPGRNGMQPQLALTYDSSAGNGWVGLGWNLNVPAITIETRWGVPRYDPALETETYLLNGEMLTPVAHRSELVSRTAEKIFHTRVEGQFRKIIRHGNHPANYWWEVIDKDGTRSFYGGIPENNSPAENSTLVDANGNIFKWALSEVRDLHNNSMQYRCERIIDVGVEGGTVPGSQLYLADINYTRSNEAPGAYTVTFIRDSQLGTLRRPDVIIDARGGFKMVTAALLKRIEVKINGEQIRAYDLAYQEGAFGKTLLQSITQRGENDTVFHSHTFSYYDEIRDSSGAYQGFASATTWNTQPDNITAGLFDFGQATALSGAINESIGGHLYLGFNVASGTKQFSAGGKVGYNHTDSEVVLVFLDINGDNLPDKIYKRDGGIYFRLNQSGLNGSTVLGPETPLPTLPKLSREESNTFSFGGEIYVLANGLVNQAETFTTSPVYFSDANGDGLPDLITNGKILFNHLDGNGIPTFSPDSSITPYPIAGGMVDTAGIIDDYESIYQQMIDTFPLQDTLTRWVAPYDGQIKISGAVTLRQDTSQARMQYQTADGVRVAIQVNGAEVWATTIAADDYASKTPTNVDAITVNKGDRIYFRVQSIFDGAYDQVIWDPEINYLNVPAVTDVNLLNPYHYKASEDFVLAGQRGLNTQMPLTGTVQLTGGLQKLGVTTDDITLTVIKNGTTVFTQALPWDQTGEIALNQTLDVVSSDVIQLRVQIDSPIDLRQLVWKPKLFYIAFADPNQSVKNDAGEYTLQLDLPYDIDLYPANTLAAPQQPWTAASTGRISVIPSLSAQSLPNGKVIFTVKKQGRLLAKQSIQITNGSTNVAPLDVDVQAGDQLFFDFSVYDANVAAGLTNATTNVVVNGTTTSVPSTIHNGVGPNLFGQPYRGWAYAGYNGNRDRANQPIIEQDLQFAFKKEEPPFDMNDPKAAQKFLTDAKAYMFAPLPAENGWRGNDTLGWVKAGQMSSSRLGMDYLSVPRSGDFGGGHAVNRLSRTSQTALNLGIGFVSGSSSDGSSYSEVDYLDVNGDSFPDIVTANKVQFTGMQGQLEAQSRAVNAVSHVRESDDDAWNLGIGGSPAHFKANARGEVATSGNGSPRGNQTGSQMVALGPEAGLGAGNADTSSDLLDINGDGLPDRVFTEGSRLKVSFNLGYTFADPEFWDEGVINDGESETGNVGASVGFNDGIYGFGGGVSLTKSKSETEQTLLDLNGDGLLDLVKPNGDAIRVSFNLGNHFAPEAPWYSALDGYCSGSTTLGIREALRLSTIYWAKVRICDGNTGAGGGLYFTIGIPACLFACYIIINPGADYSQNMARQEATFRDVNGDGYPDHIASSDDGSMIVGQNTTERTNLLRSIQRPLGATIALEYQRDGNTYAQPQSRWVMSKVLVNDGHPGDGADIQVATYSYEGGYYDRLEREFYGYAKVWEEHRDAANGDALYRTVTRQFINDSYYTKDLLKTETIQDAGGRKFTEVENSYLLRNIQTGVELAASSSLTETLFPQLVRTDERYYEGQPEVGKATYTLQQYDALGNVIVFFDAGDIGGQDDVRAIIAYSACNNTYVVGMPTKILVQDTNTIELRRREATVDCATGNMTQVRQFLIDGDPAVTDLAYFTNGNLQQVTYPANKNNERYQIRYGYDPVVATHITQVSDSFAYVSNTTHNYKYGQVETSTDINNNSTTYVYDQFGRVDHIVGPYQAENSRPTLQFEYRPADPVPWARTQHIDSYRSDSDTIDTVLFIDGLKRVVQTKKDATIHRDQDVQPWTLDVMTVSGHVEFDFMGRTIATYYPVTEPLGTPGIFNSTFDPVQPSRMSYDVLDRTTRVEIPDGTSTSMAYGLGNDRSGTQQFVTTVTDRNGIQKRSYRDVRDLITSLQEFNTLPDNSTQILWTSYSYDPLKQITRVIDDHENVTKIIYDNFGRRTIIDNPDTGKTELFYDLASNLIAKITANLRQSLGKKIDYDYEYNRLASISYPDFTENNVTYTYGGPGVAFNRAGRIRTITSEAGIEERFYGKLGEIVKEIKTIDSDVHVTDNSYMTQMSYDTWGRLQTLTYPDGEILTYQYDSGGLVRAVSGEKTVNHNAYLNRLEYDKFEQRVFMEIGNGVRTAYNYRPDNRRLNNLQTEASSGHVFQNLLYEYDGAGNILSLKNDRPKVDHSDFGGPTEQHFKYDNLYRLTSASGTFSKIDTDNQYTLEMSYDSIHNIVKKDQRHWIVEDGDKDRQRKTSYNWDYQYAGYQPHAPTRIDDRIYFYDANGNQLGWDDPNEDKYRSITWDEENRIQRIKDGDIDDRDDNMRNQAQNATATNPAQVDNEKNSVTANPDGVTHEKGDAVIFKYDDAGERVLKQSSRGETAYINPYYVVRNREFRTKNVFIGNTLLSSQLIQLKEDEDLVLVGAAQQEAEGEKGNSHSIQTTTNPAQDSSSADNTKPPAQNQRVLYFYHSDHLGSSNYVTDEDGKLYQHLEYFPFGETWVEEIDDADKPTPYRFTAKELDEETELYYFGARYYDPQTSVWQSADPMLEGYLPSDGREDLSGMGGVFNSFNVALYAYSHQNPVRLKDPDGNSTLIDDNGVVLNVKNDKDLSVYQYLPKGFAGPPAKVGETRYWDSFRSPDTNKSVGRIYLKQAIDKDFYQLAAEAKGMSALMLSIKSFPEGRFDIKSNYPGHEGKSYHGFLFKGKYMTLREVGNILAGYNAASNGQAFEDFQKAAGALQAGGIPGFLQHKLTGKVYGTAPNWGEIDYQRKRSQFGYTLFFSTCVCK